MTPEEKTAAVRALHRRRIEAEEVAAMIGGACGAASQIKWELGLELWWRLLPMLEADADLALQLAKADDPVRKAKIALARATLTRFNP